MMRNSLLGPTERTESALSLIERSERENTVVVAPWEGVIAADLFAESDGSTDAGDRVEYWGDDPRDPTRMAWRVHLRREEALASENTGRSALLATLRDLDDGTGDLGIIVDHALADDAQVTAAEIREIVLEARLDAAQGEV